MTHPGILEAFARISFLTRTATLYAHLARSRHGNTILPKPDRELFQAFDQVQIGEHAVVAEDAGLGVGGHEDGTNGFNPGRI